MTFLEDVAAIPLRAWILAGLIVWVPVSAGLLLAARATIRDLRRRYELLGRIARKPHPKRRRTTA